MSLTSYRAAPPRVCLKWALMNQPHIGRRPVGLQRSVGGEVGVVGGPGGDLLSHVLRRSTMGAAGFHGRVRNGVGWGTRAIGHQVDRPPHTACDGVGALPAAARRGEDKSAPAVRRRRVSGKSWHGPFWGFVVVADGGGGRLGD